MWVQGGDRGYHGIKKAANRIGRKGRGRRGFRRCQPPGHLRPGQLASWGRPLQSCRQRARWLRLRRRQRSQRAMLPQVRRRQQGQPQRRRPRQFPWCWGWSRRRCRSGRQEPRLLLQMAEQGGVSSETGTIKGPKGRDLTGACRGGGRRGCPDPQGDVGGHVHRAEGRDPLVEGIPGKDAKSAG